MKSNDFKLAALLVIVFVDDALFDVVEFDAGINTISLLWISRKYFVSILCFRWVIRVIPAF